MKYTENEIKMLDAFYNESINCCGCCEEGQNMSYMNANDLLKELGGTKQSIGGTMASLLEKGAILDTGESSRGLKLHDFVIVDYNYKQEEKKKAYVYSIKKLYDPEFPITFYTSEIKAINSAKASLYLLPGISLLIEASILPVGDLNYVSVSVDGVSHDIVVQKHLVH